MTTGAKVKTLEPTGFPVVVVVGDVRVVGIGETTTEDGAVVAAFDSVPGCASRSPLFSLLLLLLFSATDVPTKVKPTPKIAPNARPTNNDLLAYQGRLLGMTILS